LISSQSTTPDPSTIFQLEKLEKAIGDQLKAALAAAQKNPLDPAAQLLVGQLSAEFAMVQSSITELAGASSAKSGQSTIKATETQMDQTQKSIEKQTKSDQQSSESTTKKQSNRLRLDGTGIYVNEEV
jgi:hypothetical protein